eukprot:14542038-Heterocapsa_arctica.AAC.1
MLPRSSLFLLVFLAIVRYPITRLALTDAITSVAPATSFICRYTTKNFPGSSAWTHADAVEDTKRDTD